MRKTCLDCVTKHLGQAFVNFLETKQGYPGFRLLVIGHLAEAADESIQLYPDLAAKIRRERIKYMTKPGYEIPFFKLYGLVQTIDLKD